MSDHSFAPPGRPADNADAASEPRDGHVPAPPPADASASVGSTGPTAAEGVETGEAIAPPSPYSPGADGLMYTAAAPHDGGDYAPPARPVPPVGRLRRRAVAGISIAALVLGLAGGFGGAWAYDAWGSGVASLPDSSGATPVRPAGSVASVAAEALQSVVSIEATSGGMRTSTGSGFVIREDGYIVTNNHVVADSDGSVLVLLSDGNVIEGEVVGATADYDLAVIKVDHDGLVPMVFADSDQVAVGDPTIAVGSPLGLESTVTTGIVSAMHRPVTAGSSPDDAAFIDAIQTDAAINPGNSGGPLLNEHGEVIGVNSAVAALPGATSASGAGSVGLGFAIPSNQAKRTVEQLIETGTATYPVIGVQLDQRYTGEGVKVVDDPEGVVSGGPADRAGIVPGDVITAIDGRPVTRVDALVVAIRAMAPGDEVVLTLQDSETGEREVTLLLDANIDLEYGEVQP